MLRIIIADDHPIVRVGQKVVIEASGKCKVVGEANGPDELLALVNKTPCDVIVTDFAMPGDLVTMFANVATLRTALSHGARAVVAKSASARELPQALQTVVQGRTFVSESLRLQLDQAGLAQPTRTPQLSGKEQEVVRMLASGMTVSQIAARVNRSISTISKQKSTAMHRLCISTDVDLFAYARDVGMVP
ncbi:response regulator receiver protein [Pseudomonas sp. ABAC21]|nr:response regulator receiver protein [Pseudomonas sp. ABAC21]